MVPMMASATSLAVTPGASSPSTVTAMVLGRTWGSVWVASTCSTSLVPMPKASAPKAPWVEVWLSPHTMVMPGWVQPCSGPMTWTMPWLGSPIGKQVIPNSARVVVEHLELLSRDGVGHRLVDVGGGHVVVSRGDRQVGAAHRAPGQAESVEGLRGGDLVDQVQVDEEEIGLSLGGVDDVGVPDLLAECARGHALGVLSARPPRCGP